jgi:hypothetical protein
MRNPFGWILGFAWMLATKVHMKMHPEGGHMWLPRWIQPYWMRCMGFKVNDWVLAFYRQEIKK